MLPRYHGRVVQGICYTD